ncbi:NmrA/HSCARG family protein [Rhodohalobacter sp. 8-1]|uniref:NmrA/HSCARG family protein n=1 Tax=Rhodohalobacter sp. 8-1 TaxID=3131972 RepID=UPI0030EEF955
MKTKKIIAVTGATGAQGGGLVRAILNDQNSEFSVRALTRDKNSDKAKALTSLGAEVVEADLDDLESLKKAFHGAYGAYCVTFFWDHMSPEKELKQAENMAEAARLTGLKHVIWSTLEDSRNWISLEDDQMPTLMGKYKVPHTDAKGEANDYFKERNVPTTFFLTSFYWENFIMFGMGPQPGPDGKLAITFPMGDKKLPGIASEDIGKCAYGILKKGEDFIGRTIGIAGEHLTGAEMADGFSRLLGQEVVYNKVSPEVYRGFGFPGAEDIGNMFQFQRDFNQDFIKPRKVTLSKELNPALQNFDQWLAKNKSLFAIPEVA